MAKFNFDEAQEFFNQQLNLFMQIPDLTLSPSLEVEGSYPADSWSDSEDALGEACPNLFTTPADCPVSGCTWPALGSLRQDGVYLNRVVMHLNDHHKWPRVSLDLGDDNPELPDGIPNIADWLDEFALKNNVDLSFRTAEQIEQERQAKIKANAERRKLKTAAMQEVYGFTPAKVQMSQCFITPLDEEGNPKGEPIPFGKVKMEDIVFGYKGEIVSPTFTHGVDCPDMQFTGTCSYPKGLGA